MAKGLPPPQLRRRSALDSVYAVLDEWQARRMGAALGRWRDVAQLDGSRDGRQRGPLGPVVGVPVEP